tara:strand:+ start:1163 stop:1669 length:507 start_codon:yes stop_codon:yes gene_type:complete
MAKEKFSADIDSILKEVFNKTSTSLKVVNSIEFSKELEDRKAIKRIAFDVYRVENDPYRSLWMVQDVNGKQHLVRMSDPKFDSKAQGSWAAISDYEHKNVTLAYKNIPVARFSSDSYGFNPDDIGSFKTALLDLIDEDEKFLKGVFAEQPRSKVQDLISTFPELSKLI